MVVRRSAILTDFGGNVDGTLSGALGNSRNNFSFKVYIGTVMI